MRYFVLSLILGILCFAATPSVFGIDADKVFPESTKGFFSISSAERLAGQWRETQVGILMQQPEMKVFWEDLSRQVGTQVSSRLGLTLDDIRLIPSGEVAGGVIAPVGQKPGFVLFMDITGRLSESETLLKNLEQKLKDRKAVKSTVQITGENASVFTFEGSEEYPAQRQVVYLLSGNYFIVSEQMYLVDLIAQRLKGERSNPLAEDPGYFAVMKRCETDLGETEAEPILRWFVHPLQLGDAIRSNLNLPAKRKARTSIFQTLSEVGFDAILGIGGTLQFKADELEFVHRTYVHAPQPHRDAMNMFVFPNVEQFSSPRWIPAEVAGGTNFNFEPLEAFDNFGPLFEAFVMQGDRAWDHMLQRFKDDPYGPQMDIREEFIQHLGRGVVAFTKYRQPIDLESENLFVAIEIKNGKTPQMKQALEKFLIDDGDFERKEVGDYIFWQMKPREEINRLDISIKGPPIPGMKSTPSVDPRLEEESEPFFPKGVITVAYDHLLLSNNVVFMEEFLSNPVEESGSLSNTEDYKYVQEIFDSMQTGREPHFLRSFTRSSESVRPTYEMIRQGKLPQSKAILARVLNLLLTPPEFEEEIRPAKIDGSKMPEFESIERYFGPAGVIGIAEPGGWFIKGFSVKKP